MRPGGATAEPTNPAQDSNFASVSGGSHPTSGTAYILILTVSGMAPTATAPASWLGGGARHPVDLPPATHSTHDAWRIVIPPSEIEYSFASSS
jgi:hypothetical protein